ncbi:hypothetical protein H6A03_03935 [[Clostridium] spiroforme]|nr:hypothetical protein [Thomasclavelia spiroformis]MBM6880059.1 hypothetical protein [Thomasclavelia spiroformis]
MGEVVNFNMIVEINQMLKEKGIEYSVHAVGGCSCCGLELRQDGAPYDVNEIVDIINEYVKTKWLKVVLDEGEQMILHVQSKFDFESEENNSGTV